VPVVGLAKALRKLYVREGAKVVIADIRADAAAAVAKRLGAHASAFTCDVSKGQSVRALVDHTVKAFGIPHIVVNNAGVTHLNTAHARSH
jgi:3-oxoacyl-[acyl-carrier protein] reductase